MRNLFFILIAGLVASCRPDVKTQDLQGFKGYWEIAKVEFPGGGEKEYKVNETVDYFELKDGKGFRRKVMPQLDGTYRYASQPEEVTVVDSAGRVYFLYATDYRNWKEEVLSVSDSVLSVRNPEGIEYHYKKFESFSIK